MRLLTLLFMAFLSLSLSANELPNTKRSFSAAKRILYDVIYKDHRITFYCGCSYNEKRVIDLDSCGLGEFKHIKRALRVEAEHVFPASQFGQHLACWRESEKLCDGEKSGRKCCEKIDDRFIRAHNDLRNLFSSNGLMNAFRSNFRWGMIEGEERNYGSCDIEMDKSTRRVEAPESVKGDVARTMFYMSHTYGIALSDQAIQLFRVWDKEDPVDAWERERDDRITKVQGNRNPFIDGTITYDKNKIAKFEQAKPLARKAEQPLLNLDEKKVVNNAFSCEVKKTCSKMSCCDEAKFHLNECGNKRLDRDGNSTPCETLCKGK